MNGGDNSYIWQSEAWPRWRYELSALANALTEVSHAQGLLRGRLAEATAPLRERIKLSALVDDVLATGAIEDQSLDAGSVRSSLERRLGSGSGALLPADRHVDGIVEMVVDATERCQAPLSAGRLFGWHAALFPTGYGGLTRNLVAAWRDDARSSMRVVSGPLYRQAVHDGAPPADRLGVEMARFFEWANAVAGEPALIQAGLAQLWLLALHPFDDGNGLIARSVGDLFLTRADGGQQRFYSLTARIPEERADYREMLERTLRGTTDVTGWLAWFLGLVQRAVEGALGALDGALREARFWRRWAGTPLNARQVTMLNSLLSGFDGRLTSSAWAGTVNCSADTALRDISELLAMGMLRRTPGGGRSTGYELVPEA